MLYHKARACGRYKKGDDIEEYCSQNRTLRFQGFRAFQTHPVTNQIYSLLITTFFLVGL